MKRTFFRRISLAFALLAALCLSHGALAQVTYVSSVTAKDTQKNRIILNIPGSVVTGDIVLAAITLRPGIGLSPVESGWTLARVDAGSDPVQYVYWRVGASGSNTYTFNFTGGTSEGVAVVMAFRGVDTVSPIEASSGATYAAGPSETCSISNKNVTVDPMQAPRLQTGAGAQYLATPGAMLVAFYSNGQDKTKITPPPLITTTAGCTQDAAGTPAWNEANQGNSGGGGSGFTLEGSYQPTLCGTAGANCTGTRTAYATNNQKNASTAQMYALRPVRLVDHYWVSNAANGVNCQAENVTIVAHDLTHNPVSLDSSTTITVAAQYVSGAGGTAKGDWTLVSGGGTLANGTADDGAATYTFAAGGESSVVLALKDTWAQTVNVFVTDGASTDTSGTANADAGYNQNLTFASSGFRFVDAGNNALPNQTAGVTGGSYFLQAIQTGTGGCGATGPCVGVCTVPSAFGSGATPTVELAFQCNNPTTCQAGQQVSIINNGTTAIASNPASGVSTYTSKAMLFGANGLAAFSLNYPDVGAISLYARYNIPLGTGATSGNFMTGASNTFVVKPFGFTVSNIQRTADAFANPAAANASGAAFIRAGDSFSATVTAINQGGTATPNYGKEISPETVRLSANLVLPSGGNNPALQNPTAFGAFSAGAATGTTFSWGEVGIITLTPVVGDGDYLGAGNVTGTASANVGRFLPYDFAVSRNAPLFQPGCAAPGKDAFTYIGQPFTYQTAPVIAVTARNKSGATTLNYSAAFWKVTNTSLTAKSYTAFSGSVDTSGLPALDPAIRYNGDGIASPPPPAAGTGTLTFSAGTGLQFTRTTPVTPFDADIALSINVLDSDATTVAAIDGVAATNPVRFGQATSGNGIAFTGSTVTPGKTSREMRFGRLRIQNAYGSSRLDLPIRVEAQAYSANGFLLNSDDSCTAFSGTDMAMTFVTTGLIACNTAIAPAGAVTLSNGVASGLRLLAPGSGKQGPVDLNLNLGAASGSTCVATGGGTAPATSSSNSFLRGIRPSTGTYDQDPQARATFGIYKNSNEFIYFQENF